MEDEEEIHTKDLLTIRIPYCHRSLEYNGTPVPINITGDKIIKKEYLAAVMGVTGTNMSMD